MILRFATLLVLVVSIAAGPSAAPLDPAQLPSTVISRLKKIDTHMTRVEASLAEGQVDKSNLKWAEQYLKEIEDQYRVHANAPEVSAARDRIRKAQEASAKIEGDKQSAKDKTEQDQKNADQIAEEWAAKLSEYAPKNDPGSKGDYGTPIGKVDDILARRAHYDEANALFEEFKKTGIDKDSHWKLRDAVYSIKVGLENYEGSIERIFSNAENKIGDRAEWIATQTTAKAPYIISTIEMVGLRDMFEDVRRLFPASDPRRQALEATMAQLEKDRAKVDAVVLKTRKMKPDLYKGADVQAIKTLATSIVKKELAKPEYGGKAGTVVRVHIISSNWNTESAIEWTDTTRSALQNRVTKGMNVQVAAKVGADCFLFTLFVHRDTIGGSQSGLLGHVMFRDKFLEVNIPK